MATRRYSDRERAVLHDCRKKSALGAIKWGLPSLLPLWAGFRAGLLPRFAAAPCYTSCFVLFSFLGAMSRNDSCIESILSLEDSELATKLRKSLPKQAKRYDRKRAQENSSTVSSAPFGSVEEEAKGRRVETPSAGRRREEEENKDSESRGEKDSGEWMQRQDDRRAVRRNKYGDVVFQDDMK